MTPSRESISYPGLERPKARSADAGRKCRVLVVLNSYEVDGPGKLMLGVCQRLRSDPDLEIATVAISRSGDLQLAFRDAGIATEVVRTRGRGGLRRLRRWSRAVGRSARRPDVVHTNLLWPDLTMRVVRGALGAGRLYSTIHGLHAASEKGALAALGYGLLERATRSRCDGFVAVSAHLASEMQQAGYPGTRVRVIPNGVDGMACHPVSEATRVQMRQLLALSEGVPLVATASRLVPGKGVEVLVPMLAEVRRRHPGAVLAVAGDGPLRGTLEDSARAAGLADGVRIVGQLTRLLPAFLASADVVVVPSEREAFGLVAAEAMACGRPVLAARVGGLAEMIEDGVSGVLLAPGDAAAWASAVAALLDDGGRRAVLGERARSVAIERFEIGATAEGYRRLWLGEAGI